MFVLPKQLGEFNLRRLRLDDEALLKSWISSPDWQEGYWGDKDEEWQMLADEIEGECVAPYIFLRDAQPIGYIQYWPYGPNRDYAREIGEIYVEHFPDAAIGIDLSIGKAEHLAQGIGSQILRLFAKALIDAGAELLTIDPHRNNARAIRAYQKAGFVNWRQFGETQVMIWHQHMKDAPKYNLS